MSRRQSAIEPIAPRAPRRQPGRRAGPQERQFVTALARGLDILRAFTRHDKALGNAEIASRTGLPRPTVSRLTYTLTKLGYLGYSPDSGKYSLTVAVLSLGHAYIATLDVRDVARPLMQELADYAHATVSLGAPDPYLTHMIFLEVCQGVGQVFHMRMEVGARVPHGATAMGRAYLCALASERRQEIMERYRRHTPAADWETLREGVERAVRDYQRHGFCLSLGEWNKDVWAVGVPLVSRDGERILALNCSGPIFDMTRQKLIQDVGPRLVALRDRVLEATGGNF